MRRAHTSDYEARLSNLDNLFLDPLDSSIMKLRNGIVKNALDNKILKILAAYEEDEIRDSVDSIKELNDKITLDENAIQNISDFLDKCVNGNSDKSWVGIMGNVFQSAGAVLWMIPEVNVLWGTFAYAMGSFLHWIDEGSKAHDLKDSFMIARMNIVDDIDKSLSEDVNLNLDAYLSNDQKVERAWDWMHDIQVKTRQSEINLSRITDPFHGILFWKNITQENFLGFSVGVGYPESMIWACAINLDSDTCVVSGIFMNKDSGKNLRSWMASSSSRSFEKSSDYDISSYTPLVTYDSKMVDRVKRLPFKIKYILKNEVGYKAKRLVIFGYLCGSPGSSNSLE